MKNKILNRIAAAAMSGALALSMVSALSMPVLADDADTKIGIDKVLKFVEGVTIPEGLKFAFDVTPRSLNGVAYDGSNMPSINQLVSSFAGNSAAKDYYGQASAASDGYVTLASEFILNLDDIDWPQSGLYVYQISENAAKSNTLNASLGGNYSIDFSNAAYELQIGVENSGSGYKVTAATVKPIDGDKVDVDENGEIKKDGDGNEVTSPAGRDENVGTGDENGKVNATPSNPYGSDQADRDEDGNPDSDPQAAPDDSTAKQADDPEGTTTAGDRPESIDAKHNELTFTNTLTEVLGEEELPDSGQDLDNDPTDDPKNEDEDPEGYGHDEDVTPDEAANYHFYVGKKAEGRYADKSIYYNFNLKLAGLAGTYKAYVVSMDEKEIWSYEANPATAYTGSVNFGGTDYGCYELAVNDEAGFDFKLKSDQRLVFTRIGVGLTFTVSETEENKNGYKTSYTYTSGGVQHTAVETAGNAPKVVTVAGKNAVDVVNNLPYETPTGIIISNLPYVLLALLVVGALVASVMLRSGRRAAR